jgi:hypothetical protein
VIPDPYAKTTLVPVKVINGKLQFFYGGEIPKLKEGTICDLIVSSYAIEDERELALLGRERVESFIEDGNSLMAQVYVKNANDLDQELMRSLKKVPCKLASLSTSRFVEIKLSEDLNIKLRSIKKAELLDCECKIPSLPHLEPKSINHAYTLISQNYEKHRRSHAGNVFDKVFYHDDELWRPLADLRDSFEARNEAAFISLRKKWWFKRQEVPEAIVWASVEQKTESFFIVYCIRSDSCIVSQNYFTEMDAAVKHISLNGFGEFRPTYAPEEDIPPVAPYRALDGKTVEISIQAAG